MKPSWRGTRWFIDIEGNGAQVSEIVELGAVETIDLVPTGQTRRWLVKPHQPINFFATKIHRIRNKHVANAPSINTAIPDIMAVLQGAPVGGHAISGDLDVMARDIPQWQAASALDSLEVARLLVTDCAGYRLQRLVEHFALDETIRSLVGGRPTARSTMPLHLLWCWVQFATALALIPSPRPVPKLMDLPNGA